MLSLEDRKYILKLVEKYTPEILRKIGVDPDMKEKVKTETSIGKKNVK